MAQAGGQGHGSARVVLRAVLSPPCWAPHSPCSSPAATEARCPVRRLPPVDGRMTAPKTPFLTLGPVSSHSSGDLQLWTVHQLPQQGGCPG
ncbi:PREDICTED: LOW QUALITY PROTEIN: putative uncharacterized protein encoded by LINC00304 [Mandrillus leucophaeus]|uniref:LOW QUALITY PROTEIN: putative uncharacterized protein encoded by LINC00304 n=1 Tax=Mandrillus leucophaeus TaxID=9568 RepID=UPI0005F517DC|nr:PREDICTED: LOW QUALITY PROTEIN: putative uncharacterized protein encoded by LINC00304 [Mandrillus leucophaeus]